MRTKFIFTSWLLLALFSGTLRAGDVTVTPMSPGEAAYFMANLSKVSVAGNFYEGQSLVFYDEQGAVIKEKPVNGPTKITFGGEPIEGIDDVAAQSSTVSFFPNPATDHIHIVGLEKTTATKLYHLNGQLILTTQETDINVSGLTAGSYVLLVGSQCFKVIIQ